MRVFLYGTLLDPPVLAARSGRRGLEKAARPAWLPGWRRVALRAAPFPTLLRARSGAVPGLLLPLRGAPLRRLMAYEGAAYRLKPLAVLTRRGRCRAVAWVTAPALAHAERPRPATDGWQDPTRGIVKPSRFTLWLARVPLSRAW